MDDAAYMAYIIETLAGSTVLVVMRRAIGTPPGVRRHVGRWRRAVSVHCIPPPPRKLILVIRPSDVLRCAVRCLVDAGQGQEPPLGVLHAVRECAEHRLGSAI